MHHRSSEHTCHHFPSVYLSLYSRSIANITALVCFSQNERWWNEAKQKKSKLVSKWNANFDEKKLLLKDWVYVHNGCIHLFIRSVVYLKSIQLIWLLYKTFNLFFFFFGKVKSWHLVCVPLPNLYNHHSRTFLRIERLTTHIHLLWWRTTYRNVYWNKIYIQEMFLLSVLFQYLFQIDWLFILLEIYFNFKFHLMGSN